MKILMVVSHFFPAGVGGAERQCFCQAQALFRRGHEVMIVTKWLVPGSARTESMDGVRIWRRGCFFSVRKALRWRMTGGQPQNGLNEHRSQDHVTNASSLPSRRQRLSERVRNLIFMAEVVWGIKTGRLQADVLHVHESNWLAGFGHWLAERMSVPVFCKEATQPVLRNAGMENVPWSKQWRSRRLKCRFIAITDGIAKDLAAAGVPPPRIVNIPNGVEIPDAAADPGGHTDALYVGNFTQGGETKGFDVLLQAWGKAVGSEPGMRLQLYGRGDTSQWENYAAEHGCGSSVVFAGETDDVRAAHRRSGFLVIPSRREGLSNALLEAMASGLPSVVSDIPGNVAAVRDGVEGIVVPVGDAEALASAMVSLYRSPSRRAQMGRAARERVQDTFTIQTVVEQVEHAYRLAMAEHSGWSKTSSSEQDG